LYNKLYKSYIIIAVDKNNDTSDNELAVQEEGMQMMLHLFQMMAEMSMMPQFSKLVIVRPLQR
jgi:hypothetical protein